MADVLVNCQILRTRATPGEVMPHSVENKPAELVRIVMPQTYRTVQRRFDSMIIGLVKDISIALVWRSIATIVPVEHGIHQAADGTHDGYGAVLQADHLGQTARLEQTRHDEHICAGVNHVREFFVVTNLQVAVRIVVEIIFEMPEIGVDIHLRAAAQKHELGIVLQAVKQRVSYQVQAFLRVQSTYVGNDWFVVLAQQ